MCFLDIELFGLYLVYYLFIRAVFDKVLLIEESFLETDGLLVIIVILIDIVYCNNGKIFI